MNLSKRDTKTVATIIGGKANEMYKKGSNWRQGNKQLTCVDMGRIANKILKSVCPDEQFVFVWDKTKKKKSRKL